MNETKQTWVELLDRTTGVSDGYTTFERVIETLVRAGWNKSAACGALQRGTAKTAKYTYRLER